MALFIDVPQLKKNMLPNKFLLLEGKWHPEYPNFDWTSFLPNLPVVKQEGTPGLVMIYSLIHQSAPGSFNKWKAQTLRKQ